MSETESMSETKSASYRWAVLAVVTATVMGSFSFAWAAISPVLPALTGAFNITVSQVSYVATATFVGATSMSIPSGMLVNRLGIKWAGALALILVICGWALAFVSPSFLVLLVGRFIIGLGGMTLSVVCTTSLVEWFHPTELAFPMGILVTSAPLAAAWGIPLAGEILATTGWRDVFLAGTIVSTICLAVFLAIVRHGPIPRISTPNTDMSRGDSALRNKEVWKFNVALLFAIIPFMGVTTYWVVWEMEHKAIDSIVMASTVAGLIGVAGIFGAVGAGFLATRMKKNRPIFVLSSVVLALTIIAFNYAQGIWMSAILSLILGVAFYMLLTMMLTIPPTLVLPQSTTTALALAIASFNLAGIVGPPLIGYTFSLGGSLVWPCIVMFSCLIIAAFLGQLVNTR